MTKSRLAAAGVAAAMGAAVLVACGSGDSGAQSAQLAGVVLDGAGSGSVFLDLNQNQQADAGEPTAAVQADGSFVLPVGKRTASEIATAYLVAGSDGKGNALMAPASAFITFDGDKQKTVPAVISPLTTLAAAGVAANGLTGAEAAELLQQQLSLPGSPLSNYKAGGNKGLQGLANGAAAALNAAAENGTGPMASAERAAKALPALNQQWGLTTGGVLSADAARAAMPAAPQSADAAELFRFILKFKDGVSDPKQLSGALLASVRGQLLASYTNVVKGAAVSVSSGQAAAFLQGAAAHPGVEAIELDQRVTASAGNQATPPWGLDRIDQRSLPLSRSFGYAYEGTGVRAYIIDTGIRSTHAEFGGRVVPGYSAIPDGLGTGDCNGHGTHVAGTVGGATSGVAKGVTLVPVRVLDCSGSGWSSDIVAALDWLAANAQKPAVANMSLGGLGSALLDEAVNRVIAAGIPVVVAAGNSTANACNYSPARVPAAFTVGASTLADTAAGFSNFGTCLDMFAPGQGISSAWHTSDTAKATLDGTSMAAPHVTGVAALYLHENPGAGVEQVYTALRGNATANKISPLLLGSPNALLYSTLGAVTPPPVEPSTPPTQPTNPIVQPPTKISIGALTPTPWKPNAYFWQPRVTVAVRDQNANVVSGVVVRGSFTAGGTNLTCTTATNGTCVILGMAQMPAVASVQFTVTSLSRAQSSYDPASNVVTTVTVNQPR